MHHFWTQNEPIGPKKNFFLKTTNIILIYFLFSFIKQIFKKSLVKADPERPSRLWHCNLNWKVPGSSTTRCSIGLVKRLLVPLRLPLQVTQNWLWGSQISVKKMRTHYFQNHDSLASEQQRSFLRKSSSIYLIYMLSSCIMQFTGLTLT